MYIVYAAMLLILKYNVYTDLKGFFPNHIVDSKVDPFNILYYVLVHKNIMYLCIMANWRETYDA